MGLRIPAVLVSPYARRRHVDHNIYGFESILKLIRYRFGLAPLTTRDAYARNMVRSFDFEAKPDYEVPDLPHPPHIVSAACAAGAPGRTSAGNRASRDPRRGPRSTTSPRLHTSGYLERLGFDYRPATPHLTFRHPSAMGLKP